MTSSDYLVMSSATTTLLSPSVTDGSNESGGTQRGVNYFFGFLLTFVGLLIIFIACGVASRRRFARRRQAALDGAFEPLRRSSNGKSEGEVPPELHERPFVISDDKWSNLMVVGVPA